MHTDLAVHSIRAIALALAAAATAVAQTQTDPTVFAEQVALVRAAESLPAQGPGLFGDQVNLYTGALQFAQTDISVPGNSALSVEVRRTFVAGRAGLNNAYFGDWDLDLPALRGTFAVGVYNGGWAVDTSPTHPDYWKRCTYFAEPPEARPNIGLSRWFGYEYWFGTTLNVPGGGEVLLRGVSNNQQPQDGNAWPLVTRTGWQLRCLSSLHPQNLDAQYARGEGFLAVSPDGTSYRFDWLVSRDTNSLIKRRGGSQDFLFRRDFLIYPTEVTDRFGNWVRYNFSSTNRTQLLSITASDGRAITFGYDSFNRIASASDGVRTWTYTYSGSNIAAVLAAVVRPDLSQWAFSIGPLRQIVAVEGDPACGSTAVPIAAPSTGTMTHPSGAIGSFTLATVLHGRKVSTTCDAQQWTFLPKNFGVRSLTSKTISGPGMAAATWTYQYNAPAGSEPSCTSCPNTKTVSVTDPYGSVTRRTYGIVALVNEGQVQQLDEAWNGSSALRTTTFRYRDKSAGPYPAPMGYSPNPRSDSLDSLYHAPLDQKIVNQQGASFTWLANSFDIRARPLSVTRSSSLGYSKSETTAYHDNTARWVLGQVASVTDSSGVVERQTNYDLTTALPTASLAFGLQTESYSYYANGLLNIRYDAAGRATTYTNYQRGIPQNVAYPDATAESAVVDSLGLVRFITNGAGTTTGYGYDAMGRLASITPPGGDAAAYHPTTLAFERVAAAEYGIAGGHWRQTVTTGNARTIRYFDGLWRERLATTYDTANPAATGKAVETRYDAEGRKTFTSYAQRNPSAVDSALPGTATTYDALGRTTQVRQDSELGLLTSTTAYLSGFTRQVTNPRNFATTTSFMAWDEPSEELIAGITAPEGVNVAIVRDVFGKPRSITRSGGGASATRSYVYDGNQRLCKTIEPESGATVQAWDSANNIAWRASGLALPSTTSCDQASAPAARRISYGYDTRNRLTSTTYGDASAGVTRSYTADGQPLQVISAGSTWTYGYNNRRVPTSESLAYAGSTYAFTRGIDAYGNVASLAYPGGPTLTYSPDALGRPTQVSGHASAVSYHPNGAIAGYTLANGVVHSSTQNTRGLPLVWRDAGVVQDAYAYDANANVTAITDQQEGLSSRAMTLYDGLDRLRTVSGIWGAGSFTYDALDNLRTSAIGARSLTHNFDAATNRLTSLSGSQSIAFGYDVNGNVTSRGTQGFTFDIGNRLASAPGKASYVYDGHGRRTWVAYTGGSTKLQVYGQGGKLLYSQHSSQGNTRHVYLGERLIAEVNSISGTSYSHTDALGSPVARTSATGVLQSRTRYEPYGATAAGTNPTGIGFTGHVNDADTGLVYMQQRYYEALAGRFLSVDPVTTDAKTGGHFGRYHYAENNPYKYTDPDGRLPILLIPIALKALDAALTAADLYTAAQTGGASAVGRVALESLAGNAVPGGKVLGKLADVAGDAVKAAKGAPSFDKAREVAFQKAGMTDPSKVQFSKVDPKTGTVVEFKGEGGAKVGYDGPHKSPGPHHDTQHISWQSAGKRDSGGAQRGNEPYSGPPHPSRPDRKDQ